MNLQAFEKVLSKSGLLVFFSETWTDSKSIRRAIIEDPSIAMALGGLSQLKLENSPILVDGVGAISVSHSKKGGAILVSKEKSSIGVDIEEISRLNEKVINRVSTDQERQASPDPFFLWPAKEASFKALFPNNSDISIPQIEIQSWKNVENNIWEFNSFSGGRELSGFLYTSEVFLLAVAH